MWAYWSAGYKHSPMPLLFVKLAFKKYKYWIFGSLSLSLWKLSGMVRGSHWTVASGEARLELQGLRAEGGPRQVSPEGGAQGPARPSCSSHPSLCQVSSDPARPAPGACHPQSHGRAQIWAGCIWPDKPLELPPPLWAGPSLDPG